MKAQFLIIAVSLLVLPHCSYKKYRVKRLNNLTHATATYTETKENITVKAKKFTSRDSKDFFYDVDLMRGKKNKIQSVHVTVENNRESDIKCVFLVPDGTRISKALVARQLYIGCASLLATTYVSGVAAWFLLAGSCASLVIAGTCGTAASAAFIAAGVLGIAGAVCLLGVPLYTTYYRKKVNDLIDEQLALNSLYKSNYLLAHEILNGLVYCKGGCLPNVQIACFDNEQLLAIFSV